VIDCSSIIVSEMTDTLIQTLKSYVRIPLEHGWHVCSPVSQAVSLRLPTATARDHVGVVVDKDELGQFFRRGTSVSPTKHSTDCPGTHHHSSHIFFRGGTIGQ
jgi:hypothetical protein